VNENKQRNIRLEGEVRIKNKVFAKKVGVGPVIAVPGELDIATAAVGIVIQSSAIGLPGRQDNRPL
jgi:hypothetical protein